MKNIVPMSKEEVVALELRRDSARGWWELSAEEVARAYAAHVRNFRLADLSGADLSRADLSGADLSGAYLSGAYLSGAYLSRAYLSRADLSRADLSGADLSRADLSRADLSGAYLSRADLSRADLSRADLSGADLSGADLSRAYLSRAYLSRADLSRADLSGTNLIGVAGVYSDYSPNLSSRGGALLGGLQIVNGKIVLRFWAGCKESVTAEALLGYVKETHEDNLHAQHYRAAIRHIQVSFKIDMKAGAWDYLLTWVEDHPKMAKFNEAVSSSEPHA